MFGVRSLKQESGPYPSSLLEFFLRKKTRFVTAHLLEIALGSNDLSRLLPIASGWQFSSMSDTEAVWLFAGGQDRTNEFIPSLPGITRCHSSNRFHSSLAPQIEGLRVRGWQRPGPGPKGGRARIPAMNDLKSPFFWLRSIFSRRVCIFSNCTLFARSHTTHLHLNCLLRCQDYQNLKRLFQCLQ